MQELMQTLYSGYHRTLTVHIKGKLKSTGMQGVKEVVQHLFLVIFSKTGVITIKTEAYVKREVFHKTIVIIPPNKGHENSGNGQKICPKILTK